MDVTAVRRFFTDPLQHSAIWQSYLANYVSMPNKAKDYEKFKGLDNWYHALDLHKSYITRDELVEIMKWKLTRGKMRPLLKKIEALADDDVKMATFKGLLCLNSGIDDTSIKAALEGISKPLNGVGPATASAILARWSSDLPFMSDAGLIATGIKLDYTIADYLQYYHAIRAKVAELNADDHTPGYIWTAKAVEAVLHIVYSRFDLKVAL